VEYFISGKDLHKAFQVTFCSVCFQGSINVAAKSDTMINERQKVETQKLSQKNYTLVRLIGNSIKMAVFQMPFVHDGATRCSLHCDMTIGWAMTVQPIESLKTSGEIIVCDL